MCRNKESQGVETMACSQQWYHVYSDISLVQYMNFILRFCSVRPHVLCAMMTSSNGNIFRVTGHLCGEFTGPRWIPCTKASDAEFWCFLWSVSELRLSKQPWGWWFETLSWSLWRHCNGNTWHWCTDFARSLLLQRPQWLFIRMRFRGISFCGWEQSSLSCCVTCIEIWLIEAEWRIYPSVN